MEQEEPIELSDIEDMTPEGSVADQYDDITVQPELVDETAEAELEPEERVVIAEPPPLPNLRELNDFFTRRKKNPSLYGYDGQGNLVIRNKDGSIDRTITLPKYRPLTIEEVTILEEARREMMIEAQENFDTQLQELQETIKAFNEGREMHYKVKEAQLAVEMADIALSHARYPVYSVKALTGVKMMDIYPDIKLKDRVVDHPMLQLIVGAYDPKVICARPMSSVEQQEEEKIDLDLEDEPEQTGGMDGGSSEMSGGSHPGRAWGQTQRPAELDGGSKLPSPGPSKDTVILFNRPDDNEYGYLANDWPIDINWKGVKYFTVDQALAAEKARYFGRTKDLQEIMRTRSTTTMRSIARKFSDGPQARGSLVNPLKDEPKHVETDSEKIMREQKTADWDKAKYNITVSILMAKFRQHDKLGKLLKETGDAVLAKADHRDIEDGIGIAIENPNAGHPQKWRGKNLLGKSLMEVRTQLRAGHGELTKTEGQIVQKKSITEEEAVDKAKAAKATVINQARAAAAAKAKVGGGFMKPF